jgi:hypothetical protein
MLSLEKRFVSMALFYTQDGEKQYQPKGFEPSTIGGLRFPVADGWEKHTKKLKDEIHSAFHR